MTTMVTLTITKFLRCLFREKSDKKIIFPFVLYLLETVKSFEDSLSAMQRMQRQLSYQNACACVCTHPWTRGQSRRDASKIVLSLLSLSLSLSSFILHVACNPGPSLVPARRTRSRSPLATSPVKTAWTGRSRARGREIGVVQRSYVHPRAIVCVRVPRAYCSRLGWRERLREGTGLQSSERVPPYSWMVGPAGTG